MSKPRRPSLAERLADHAERQAFANAVLLASADHQHESCAHADCAAHGPCRLREALEASAARIAEEGSALVAEQRRRRKGTS